MQTEAWIPLSDKGLNSMFVASIRSNAILYGIQSLSANDLGLRRARGWDGGSRKEVEGGRGGGGGVDGENVELVKMEGEGKDTERDKVQKGVSGGKV